jgi:prepilin-type processing-associated H-X9-DG protein
MHIDAPAPRKGLAKMLDGNGALAADTFALVPRSAVLAGAATIELPPIYDMIHDWAVNSDNMDPAQWQDVERRVQGLLGVPPRQFLDALGPDWVWYGDAQIGGSSPLGMVMVNRLDEPATVEAALGQVIMIANSMLTFAKPMPEMQFSIRRQMWGEATMFYASVPGVAPTIMVHDGRLYIGLYPQTVVSAAALHDRNAPSILTSPKFQQVQRAVLPAGRQLDEAAAAPRVQSFSYVDVRQASVSGYSMLLMVTRYVQGTADIFGLNTPPLLIPPLHAMQGQLQPAGAMTWADEAGWHYKSVTPFPGALMMAAQTNLSVGQAALAAGILLPAINRAREIASRTASGANLRALGQAVFVYEAQHGRYPDHVAPLILDGTITPMLLIVPGEPMPDTPDYEAKEAAWRKWVDQHSDYVYLGMSDKTPAGDVVAYEKFDPKNPPEGLNILYGDGHVEWHHYEGAKEELRRAGVIGGGDE